MPTFTNQATLTYNNVTTNSNIVTGNIVETLSMTKAAVVDTYSGEDSITYVVNLVNTGTAAFTNLTVTDDLGAYTNGALTVVPLTYVEGSMNYYVNGVLQPDPTVTVTDGISVAGITVPASGNAMLIYEVRTNEFAPLADGTSIVNTVTATGAALAQPLTATATVTPVTQASLSIVKSLSPSTVAENGTLTYTFVVQNTGNTATVATDNIVITDTFNPVLNDIVVTYNGTTLTEGTDYTYENGVFTLLNGIISVPAATYTQDPATGVIVTTPGTAVVTVTGTV